jgi:hypothetical protein
MSRRTMRRAMLLLGSVLGVLAIFSPAAFASGLPIITAGTPELPNLTIAKLEGSIDPNGSSTTYKVEYGKTKLYGQTTQSFTIGSGSEPVPFTIQLPGVEQMSTYHFRVSATNSSGTTTTSDATFESLHSWTVEGKRVTELGSPANFADHYKSGVSEGHVEFRGILGNKAVRVYCKQSASMHGALGVEFAGLVFKNGCFFQEVESQKKLAACKPMNGITLNLNGGLGQTAPIVIELGEPGVFNECAWGETMTIANGGFYVPLPLPEATSLEEVFFGYAYADGGSPVEAVFSAGSAGTPGSLSLTGVNAGKKFGAS